MSCPTLAAKPPNMENPVETRTGDRGLRLYSPSRSSGSSVSPSDEGSDEAGNAMLVTEALAVSTGSSGGGSTGEGISGGQSPSHEDSDEKETAAAATKITINVRALAPGKRKAVDSSDRRGRTCVYSPPPPSSGSSGDFPQNSSDSDETETTNGTTTTTTGPTTRGSSESSPPLNSQNLAMPASAHKDKTTPSISTGSSADFPQNSTDSSGSGGQSMSQEDSDEAEGAAMATVAKTKGGLSSQFSTSKKKKAKAGSSEASSSVHRRANKQHLTTVRMQVHNEEAMDRTLPAPDPMSMWLRSNRMTSQEHQRLPFFQQMPQTLTQNPESRGRQAQTSRPPPSQQPQLKQTQQQQERQQHHELGSNLSSSSSSDPETAGMAESLRALNSAVWGMQEQFASERRRVDGVIEALIMIQDFLMANGTGASTQNGEQQANGNGDPNHHAHHFPPPTAAPNANNDTAAATAAPSPDKAANRAALRPGGVAMGGSDDVGERGVGAPSGEKRRKRE